MKRFDQSSAVCKVFTYKEGLFSALAHDLRISVTSFILDLGGEEHFIKASFDTRSLHVDLAMADGEERPSLLSERDKKDIDENIIRHVLDVKLYLEITLTASSAVREDSVYKVKGTLAIHGKTRELSFTIRREGENHVADVRLHLPDFGIKPFSALFGAIKVKPDVLIQVMIPTEKIDPDIAIPPER